ncbi:hypothetical protein QTN25_002343 [Entamoeba marina]
MEIKDIQRRNLLCSQLELLKLVQKLIHDKEVLLRENQKLKQQNQLLQMNQNKSLQPSIPKHQPSTTKTHNMQQSKTPVIHYETKPKPIKQSTTPQPSYTKTELPSKQLQKKTINKLPYQYQEVIQKYNDGRNKIIRLYFEVVCNNKPTWLHIKDVCIAWGYKLPVDAKYKRLRAEMGNENVSFEKFYDTIFNYIATINKRPTVLFDDERESNLLQIIKLYQK